MNEPPRPGLTPLDLDELVPPRIARFLGDLTMSHLSSRCEVIRPGEAYSDMIPDIMRELGISVAGTVVYDTTRRLVKHKTDERAARRARVYTELELIEIARRALALNLSGSVNRLELEAIETTKEGEAVAHFRLPDKTVYCVSIRMMNSMAMITRLNHLWDPYPPRATHTHS